MKYFVLALLFAGACIAVPQLGGLLGSIGSSGSTTSKPTADVCKNIKGLSDNIYDVKSRVDNILEALGNFIHYDSITFHFNYRICF